MNQPKDLRKKSPHSMNASRKHTYIILTPLNPTFVQWNWGLQGYTLFFLFLLKNIDCGYSLEPPHRGLKSLLQQGLSELEFYGDLVYKFRKNICLQWL